MSEATSGTVVAPPHGEAKMPAPAVLDQTVHADWDKFSKRVVEPGADDSARPKVNETELEKASAEELEEWKKTGKISKSDSPEPSAEKDAKNAEPPKEHETPKTPPNSDPRLAAYDRLLERASKEPEFETIVQRMNEPFFPMSREGVARYEVMRHALTQVSNADDVVYFLSQPQNGSVALNMQNAEPHQIAQVIHTVSAQLRFGAKKEAKEAAAKSERPSPRAPKPPSEVGGRGAPPRDALLHAAENNDFKAFDKAMTARYKSAHK